MVWTILRINFQRLLHNRVELLLTFVVPIVFFSVFAVIFGGGLGSGATPKVKVVVVDEVDSALSKAVVKSLREGGGLRFMSEDEPASLPRSDAESMVRRGGATMAIVLTQQEKKLAAELLVDASDQVAGQVVSALVTRSLLVASGSLNSQTRAVPNNTDAPGVSAPTADSLPNPPPDSTDRKSAVDMVDFQSSETNTNVTPIAVADPQAARNPEIGNVEIIDIIGTGKANPVVSMYAAGIAVMFLLFGASGGGGALLDERESQTLDRLLSTQMTMDQLLLGKWFYLTIIGVLQVTIMFVWGQVAFEVDLVGHLDGFVMMTVVTSAAAAAFGLFLATLCKSRGQLNGLSVILILTMSALGGSMVPRYVMNEKMREVGLWTFNAWALDGYDKVFWRDLPVSSLEPQLMVLLASALVFLLIARILAIRWECD